MAGKIPVKILVVDDDESVRRLCSEVLSGAGYRVETALSGIKALNLLKEAGYDLIITDVHMPELDGIGLYGRVARDYPALKDSFLFMTGDLSDDKRSAIMRLGKECIIKPFRIMDLLGRVDKLVARSIENISSKTGRKEERLRIVTDCEIFKEDGRRVLAAKSQDVSLNGLKVRYAGGPLKPRTTVLVSVKMNFLDLLIGAMIVWSKAVSMHDSVAGLRLNDPIPPSSLSALSRLNKNPA